MEYKSINNKAYNIHMIKTDLFKTITFRVVFSKPIEKDNITKMNMLQAMLCYSTKKYPNKQSMAVMAQDLYGADVYGGVYRIGNYLNLDIFMSILNPKYTEEFMLHESISFLKEIINNPNVSNNKFDSNSFNIVKNIGESKIKSLIDNQQKYTISKMLEILDNKKAYSYQIAGTLEELSLINEENLYSFYKDVLSSSVVDVFVIGNFDFDVMSKELQSLGEFNSNRKDISKDCRIVPTKYNKLKELTIESTLNQSKLAIGCQIFDANNYELNYVLPLLNHIFGGNGDSKLFMNVREKKSFCYYIDSFTNKFDSLLIIRCGISLKNYEKVLAMIKEELVNLQQGNITQLELDKAKSYYLSSLQQLQDYPKSIIEIYFGMEILGSDNIETKIKSIKSVTIEDIINLSKKIEMSAVCLLKEGETSENN